jgi:histidinol-phosphate aminotransferase
MDASDYNTGHALVNSGNTVVLHTASKIYGLPALRLGFAHAPAPIIDVLNRIRGPFNVNALALAAGIAAFSDQNYIATIRKKNAAERARVSDALNAFGYNVVPSHTNFVLVHVGAHADALGAHLSNAGIIVRDVKAYGLPEYLRISIGTEEENTLMLEAIKRFSASSAA